VSLRGGVNGTISGCSLSEIGLEGLRKKIPSKMNLPTPKSPTYFPTPGSSPMKKLP
jgi:hypothetical protein